MTEPIKKLGIVIENSDRNRSGISGRKLKKSGPSLNRPKLLGVMHFHQRPGCHPVPRILKNDEQCFELVTGGRGWLEVDGEWKEVTPGDLLWQIEGCQTIGRSDFLHPYSCLSVRFIDPGLQQKEGARITRWEELDEVKRFTTEVVRLHADDSFDSGVLLRYCISRLHFQAELFMRRQKEQGLPDELQRTMEMINRRYAKPLRLSELARAAGWSVPHLHDRFKEHLGLTPHQALIRRRIQAAREILASTNDPVKSVADHCGFPTAPAFCVQFKKATRLSPTEYRKHLRHGSSIPGSPPCAA